MVVARQPPRAESCKEPVRYPESSPCFSHVLKYYWSCPKANQIDKSCVSHILIGCHLAMARCGLAMPGLGARACLCTTSWASESTAFTFVTGIQRGGCCRSQVLHLYGVLKSHHVSYWGRPRGLLVF